jgi:hypothetical protein
MTEARKRALPDMEDAPAHTHDKQPRLEAMIEDDESKESEPLRPIDTPDKAYFPIMKKSVLLGWACVSPHRLQDVLLHGWNEFRGYPVNEKGRRLHAFIFYDLMKQEECDAIDHRNNDKRDASDDNLAGGSHSDNSRNRKKKSGLTSQYHGVVLDRAYWRSHERCFRSEIAAAWFHDQFEVEHHPKSQNLNHVEKPDDYDSMIVVGTKRRAKEDRHLIEMKVGQLRWGVKICRNNIKVCKYFATKEEAILYRDSTLQEMEEQRLQEIENRVITRNGDGIAYINNEKTKGFTLLMSDATWRFVQDKGLHVKCDPMSNTNYAFIYFMGKTVALHRYLMGRTKRDDNLVVDHINLNPMDDRESNLRVIENGLNHQNSAPRSTVSTFKGVRKSGKKWSPKIMHKGTEYYLGTYDTDVLAAAAYNAMATELYAPEIPYLNPVQIPDGYTWNSSTRRIVQV